MPRPELIHTESFLRGMAQGIARIFASMLSASEARRDSKSVQTVLEIVILARIW
jgi:hypothetical protein